MKNLLIGCFAIASVLMATETVSAQYRPGAFSRGAPVPARVGSNRTPSMGVARQPVARPTAPMGGETNARAVAMPIAGTRAQRFNRHFVNIPPGQVNTRPNPAANPLPSFSIGRVAGSGMNAVD